MKKIILLTIAVTTAVTMVNAQEFVKDDWIANAGVSISYIDPLFLGGSVEYGIVNNVFNVNGLTLGVGNELGYSSKSTYGVKATALIIGVRASFHYSPVANLDLYTAPAILYGTGTVSVGKRSETLSSTKLGLTLIGARYFFYSNIGAFLELGHNNALDIATGLSFKF